MYLFVLKEIFFLRVDTYEEANIYASRKRNNLPLKYFKANERARNGTLAEANARILFKKECLNKMQETITLANNQLTKLDYIQECDIEELEKMISSGEDDDESDTENQSDLDEDVTEIDTVLLHSSSDNHSNEFVLVEPTIDCIELDTCSADPLSLSGSNIGISSFEVDHQSESDDQPNKQLHEPAKTTARLNGISEIATEKSIPSDENINNQPVLEKDKNDTVSAIQVDSSLTAEYSFTQSVSIFKICMLYTICLFTQQ